MSTDSTLNQRSIPTSAPKPLSLQHLLLTAAGLLVAGSVFSSSAHAELRFLNNTTAQVIDPEETIKRDPCLEVLGDSSINLDEEPDFYRVYRTSCISNYSAVMVLDGHRQRDGSVKLSVITKADRAQGGWHICSQEGKEEYTLHAGEDWVGQFTGHLDVDLDEQVAYFHTHFALAQF